MDKELLRIIIIATGLVVIIAMLLWGYIRNQRVSRDMSFFADEKGTPKSNFNPKDYVEEDVDFDLDMVPLGSARFADEYPPGHEQDNAEHAVAGKEAVSKPILSHGAKSAPVLPVAKAEAKENLPRLVQFSIVAKNEQGFNGSDLAAVFTMVGLEYGSMKIYERLDIHRMVDFGVASMINPGTFPETEVEMAEFYTPGITFFMQPRELPDPILVYDDLVRTINLIAKELDGQKWDAERKALSEFTLKIIRKSLQVN